MIFYLCIAAGLVSNRVPREALSVASLAAIAVHAGLTMGAFADGFHCALCTGAAILAAVLWLVLCRVPSGRSAVVHGLVALFFAGLAAAVERKGPAARYAFVTRLRSEDFCPHSGVTVLVISSKSPSWADGADMQLIKSEFADRVAIRYLDASSVAVPAKPTIVVRRRNGDAHVFFGAGQYSMVRDAVQRQLAAP